MGSDLENTNARCKYTGALIITSAGDCAVRLNDTSEFMCGINGFTSSNLIFRGQVSLKSSNCVNSMLLESENSVSVEGFPWHSVHKYKVSY